MDKYYWVCYEEEYENKDTRRFEEVISREHPFKKTKTMNRNSSSKYILLNYKEISKEEYMSW